SVLQIDPNHKPSRDALNRLSAPSDPRQQQVAAEFNRLMQQVQQLQDPEQRIVLAQEALRLEPSLAPWPFPSSREAVKGELWFHVPANHQRRRQGDPADNLEKGIAAYERALGFWTREINPRGWALIQNNLALAYSNRLRGNAAENLEK